MHDTKKLHVTFTKVIFVQDVFNIYKTRAKSYKHCRQWCKSTRRIKSNPRQDKNSNTKSESLVILIYLGIFIQSNLLFNGKNNQLHVIIKEPFVEFII